MPKKNIRSGRSGSSGKKARLAPSSDHSLSATNYDERTVKTLQRFIAGTAQEIQHPLKSIAERMQAMITKYKHRDFEYIGYKEYKDIFKTLQAMNEELRYCYDTAERLLFISKKELGFTKKHCDVNAAIQEVKGLIANAIEVSDIQLDMRLAPGLPYAGIGSLELSQVLLNIATNAIQSMPTGGTIRVKTRYEKETDGISIECSDEGVGISKEVLPYVFEPFFTTKERGLRQSSGLGLAIVRSIIEGHKGKIQIKSDQRKGTSVLIWLPAYKNGRKKT